jgi:hypothetical protein
VEIQIKRKFFAMMCTISVRNSITIRPGLHLQFIPQERRLPVP